MRHDPRGYGLALLGIAVGLAVFVLQAKQVKVPEWALICLSVLAAGLVLWGSVLVFWAFLSRVRLCWPIFLVDATAPEIKALFLTAAGPASRELEMLTRHLWEHLRRLGGPHSELARLFPYVQGPYAQARNAVQKATESEAPTQPQFSRLYHAYQDLVDEVRQIGIATSYDFRADGNYSLWRRHDTEFMKELHGLVAKESFSSLRQEIVNYKWPEGQRQYWA